MIFLWKRIGLVLFVTAMLSVQAWAGATIIIINQNGAGVGFNDPTPAAPVGGNSGTTIGQQRLIAFQFAADIWGATLDSTVTINVQAQFSALSCTDTSGTLGSAGTTQITHDFANAEFTSTWYSLALARKQAGTNILAGNNDINANFNSNVGTPGCLSASGWYYGLDTNQLSSQVNLVTVVLHELAHGLGFQQFASISSDGSEPSGLTDVFGRRIFDLTQNLSWNQMTDGQRLTSAINSRKVVWTGPTVTAAAPSVLTLGSPLFNVTAPPGIAGTYAVGTADFGPPLSGSVISGVVLQALDTADVSGPTTTDGCTAITNGGALSGKIALVDRGTCNFVVKAKNVQNAGAIAMVVVDNVAGAPPPGMGGADATVVIPSVRISLADGNTVKAQLANGVNASFTLNLNQLSGADSLGRVILNAPDPFQPGSSIAHWDPLTSRNQLMEPNISNDLTHSVKAPEDLTLALLRDIGWAPATAPAAAFSTTAVAFGNSLMGYGAFNRTVMVSNTGTGAMTISSIVVSGSTDFTRTHNCPGSLAPAASCTVTVLFNPTVAALRTGTLTITTNAPGSPHLVSLTGTGINDLAFSLARPKRPVRTGTGQANSTQENNTFELTITPAAGFGGFVALGCAGGDAAVTCTVQPGTVSISGAPVTAMLTVNVAGRSLRLRRKLPTSETHIIRISATVGDRTRVVELQVLVTR